MTGSSYSVRTVSLHLQHDGKDRDFTVCVCVCVYLVHQVERLMCDTPTRASRVNLICNIFHKLATQDCQDSVLESLDPEVYRYIPY